MNKVILSGRLARDPEIRYSQGAEPIAITRFSIAVNRRFRKDSEPDVDFINCIAFGKTGEFISKYFIKGKMIGISGNIRNNNWTDQNGQKRYSTEVFVEEAEFLESKSSFEGSPSQNQNFQPNQPSSMPMKSEPTSDDFYNIESGVEDDNLPF